MTNPRPRAVYKLTDRLRGKYEVGPHLPNGEPEFGWRQFEAPQIQHEAADEIKRLQSENERLIEALNLMIEAMPNKNDEQDAALDKAYFTLKEIGEL